MMSVTSYHNSFHYHHPCFVLTSVSGEDKVLPPSWDATSWPNPGQSYSCWGRWSDLRQNTSCRFCIFANNSDIQMTAKPVVPHGVAVFVRTSIWAAYGDSPTAHKDFVQTKLLWVEVGAGLCCHGLWYALVPGRGAGSAGRIHQGRR